MSESKVTIRLEATGAPQAAAEAEKVNSSMEAIAASATKATAALSAAATEEARLAAVKAQFMTAAEAEVAANEKVYRAYEKGRLVREKAAEEERRQIALKSQFMTASEAEQAVIHRETDAIRQELGARKKANDEAAKTPAILGPVAKSFDELEKEVRDCAAALNQLPVGSEQFVAMTGRLRAAQAQLNTAQQTAHRVTGRVAMSAGMSRMAMQNVGYQVQDMAVQMSSGTGAMRSMSQQLPQLASGFGPVGVVLGTVAAVALPIAGTIWKMRDSMDDGAVSADEYADKLSELSKKRVEQQIKKDLAEQEKWVEGLKKEKAAIEDINTALGNEVAARRRVEDEKRATETAIREEKIAAIKASDKPEAQKAREIAALEAEAVRSDTEGRLTALKRMEEDALREESNAKRNEEVANSTANQAAEKLAQKREEQATAKGQLIQGEAARKRAVELRREKANSEISFSAQILEGVTPEEISAFKERQAQLTKEIEEQDFIGGKFDPEQLNKSLKALDLEVSRYEEQLKQEEAAYEAAARESKNRTEFAKTAVQEARERSEEVKKQGQSKSRAHRSSSSVTIKDAIEDNNKKKDQEDEKTKRETRQREDAAANKSINDAANAHKDGKDALNTSAKTGAGRLFKGAGTKNNDVAQRVARSLENGTNAEEIERLQREVQENAGKLPKRVLAGINKMLAELAKQAAEVDQMGNKVESLRREKQENRYRDDDDGAAPESPSATKPKGPAPAPADANLTHPNGPYLPGIPLPPQAIPEETRAAQENMGREAVKLLTPETDRRIRNAIEYAAAGLQDGDQGGEVERLIGHVESLAAEARASGGNMKQFEARLNKIDKTIGIIKSQFGTFNRR